MRKILKAIFREDLNLILDGKAVLKHDFVKIIIHYILENRSINLHEVLYISNELERNYMFLIDDVDDLMSNTLGNLIEVFAEAKREFNRLDPVIKEIENLQENGRSKNYFKQVTGLSQEI